MKATEQYFPVVLFIMLYKVVLTFESVDEILWCDHLNETSSAVLLHDTICFSIFYQIKFGFFLEFCLSVWFQLGIIMKSIQCFLLMTMYTKS